MIFHRTIKKYLKKGDAKILFENFISLSAVQLIGYILPVITLPYVLRVIGFEKFGIISLAWTLINYFTSVTDYSFRITATRDVAIFKNSQRKLNLIYSKVMTVQFLLQLVSYSIIIAVIYVYKPFYNERVVYWLTIPFLFGNTIFPDWFFQGIEKMKYISFINVSVKIFFAALIFILIKSEQDYWIYPLLQSAGFVLSGLIGQIIIRRKYKLRFFWIGKKCTIKTLKSNFPIFANQFLPNLYNNSSTFLLGIFSTNSVIGMYASIRRITTLLFTALGLVSRVFFPFLNREKNAFMAYKKLMRTLGFCFAIIPIIFYKPVFWFLNAEPTLELISVLGLLCMGLYFIAIYDIYGLNYFIIRRKDKIVMRNTFSSSIIGFILAFPVIYYWGIIGAALNLAFSQLLMGGGLYFKYLKQKDV